MDPYTVLGVSKEATTVEIKKAYRKVALQCHPDKNPDPEAAETFKNATAAYEILSDESSRAAFDEEREYGMPGRFDEDEGEFSAQDFFDFFNNRASFEQGRGNGRGQGAGGRGRGSSKNFREKTPDAHLDVKVSLQDLFKGKVVKLRSARDALCRHCRGAGHNANAQPIECKTCKGTGLVKRVRRVGPGMVTTDHVECKRCVGKGFVVRSKDRCKKCAGKGLCQEQKILEFTIPSGSRSGDCITLEKESDQALNKDTGDVILRIVQEKDEVFERKGDDLYAKVEVTLQEALCGFSRVVMKHLDGTGIRITVKIGKVLRPGDSIVIPGQGMPILNSDSRGDLHLEVVVIFPEDNWCVEKADGDRLMAVLPSIRMTEIDVPTNDVYDAEFEVVRGEQKEEPKEEEEERGYENGDEDFKEGCAAQ